MKRVTITKYESFDGRVFDSEEECRTHEKDNLHFRLASLTSEQVLAALNREDATLAELFEQAGDRIKKARLASGDLKRKRQSKITETSTPAEPPSPPVGEAAPPPSSASPISSLDPETPDVPEANDPSEEDLAAGLAQVSTGPTETMSLEPEIPDFMRRDANNVPAGIAK